MSSKIKFDSVIIISQSRWHTEMRSNRYHYATRFSRLVPTYFIQLRNEDDQEVFEKINDHLFIVSPILNSDQELFKLIFNQLRKNGCSKPLVWRYAPYYLDILDSITLKSFSVYHATEAYFGSDLIDESRKTEYQDYLKQTRRAINSSDCVISVSEGVSSGIRSDQQIITPVYTVTNGCDYNFWRSKEKKEREDAVLYQGGIHRKLDFELIYFLVDNNKEIDFWFCGDLSINSNSDKNIWKSLLNKPNFKYFGKLKIDEVVKLAHKAKIGLIPFRLDDYLVKKSFPLKAFEYLSAGLEVISTPIDSLSQFQEHFNISKNRIEIDNLIKEKIHSHNHYSVDRFKACEAQDYDRKFENCLNIISDFEPPKSKAAKSFKKNLLLFYDEGSIHVGTIKEHINSFGYFSKHNITFYNATGSVDINKDFLDSFEAIIIHYSVRLSSPGHLSEKIYSKLKNYFGKKFLFIQDEYDNLKSTYEYMDNIDFDVVYTCVPKKYLNYVYPKERFPSIRFVQNLTGYISYLTTFNNLPKLSERSIDVFYRGRELPYIYGSLGRDKYLIGQKFHEACITNNAKLKLDLSSDNNNRIYGDAWFRTIMKSRTMLGTESGSNVFDFDGNLNTQIQAEIDAGHDYEYIYDNYLSRLELQVRMNQISPKMFEAIGLKTVLVLYEGEYSEILEPNRHYISLKKDFSNFKEVLSKIQNSKLLEEISNRAYDEVGQNVKYSYPYFIREFDNIVDETVPLITEQKIIVPKLYTVKDSYVKGISFPQSNFIRNGFSSNNRDVSKNLNELILRNRIGTIKYELLYPLRKIVLKLLSFLPKPLLELFLKLKNKLSEYYSGNNLITFIKLLLMTILRKFKKLIW